MRYFLKHDKLLLAKCLRAYLRRGLIKGKIRYHPDIYGLYGRRVEENLGGLNGVRQKDFVLEAFLSRSFAPHAFPRGYFQDIRYLEGLDSILHKEFSLKTPLSKRNALLKKHIDSTPKSVFLHIRLGDYLETSSYVRLGATYYAQALEILKKQLGTPHIFVFSNDIAWCEEHLARLVDFSGCGLEFVKGNHEGNAAEEMELMRACKHAIVANSTFSWWAAYLMSNPQKIVIMPEYFFNDPLRIPRGVMIAPKGWILLDSIWGQHFVVE